MNGVQLMLFGAVSAWGVSLCGGGPGSPRRRGYFMDEVEDEGDRGSLTRDSFPYYDDQQDNPEPWWSYGGHHHHHYYQGTSERRPKTDLSTTAIVTLTLKLLFVKLKAIGLAKLLFFLVFLVKGPLLIGLVGFKAMLAFKAMKVLKVAALLPFLAPLVLLLLPIILLLPLLLLFLIPVPVLVPPAAAATGRRRRRHVPLQYPLARVDEGYDQLSKVLEAEQCLRRIACDLANRNSSLISSLTSWFYRHMMALFGTQGQVEKNGDFKRWKICTQEYSCSYYK